jgi:hypothetical protein
LDTTKDFPVVGGQFNGPGAEVTAASAVQWTGTSYTISVSISRNKADLAENVRAPFASALLKIGSTYDIVPMINEMRNVPLTFDRDVFEVRTTLRAEPLIKAMYVIQQPIMFQRPNGKVCFTAPVYSPVPIPDKFLSCDLLR